MKFEEITFCGFHSSHRYLLEGTAMHGFKNGYHTLSIVLGETVSLYEEIWTIIINLIEYTVVKQRVHGHVLEFVVTDINAQLYNKSIA